MNTTIAFILSIVLVSIVFDVLIAMKRGGNATISWQLYTLAQKYPLVGVFVGIVIGHIFGQMSVSCS